jgi:hypothetical protein
MYAFEVSLRYRLAVKERNLDAVLETFSDDAVIETPLKGVIKPKPYHEWLFAQVKDQVVKVQNLYQALNGDISISIHSQYEWVLNDDEVIKFGVVSLFEFTEDRLKIRKMSNFYDTFKVRSALEKAKLHIELAKLK